MSPAQAVRLTILGRWLCSIFALSEKWADLALAIIAMQHI
jgi:hypothetical protein